MESNLSLLDLFVFALAVAGLVDVLLHGSIFASFRARMEAYGDWRAQLFGCPYCLTYQAALWLILLFWFVPAIGLPAWMCTMSRLPIYFLAIARLTWALDGLLPEHVRYTRPGL